VFPAYPYNAVVTEAMEGTRLDPPFDGSDGAMKVLRDFGNGVSVAEH
jgi:hypothetical protein